MPATSLQSSGDTPRLLSPKPSESISDHCVASSGNASSAFDQPSPSLSGQAFLPPSVELPASVGQSSVVSDQPSLSVSTQPVVPSVEAPARVGQSSLTSLNPSASSSTSSSLSRHPSPSMSLVAVSEIQVGRGGSYEVYGQRSLTSRTWSLSSSASSTSSLQPSLSQSVEAEGFAVSCILVQLNSLFRGQRSGKLSVKPSLSSSESHSSPCWSPSVLACPGLETVGQLSSTSTILSPSESFSEEGSKTHTYTSLPPVDVKVVPSCVIEPEYEPPIPM